ncbi:serine/threonine protein kinase [Pendulispora rubella]|uniref:Serine/threonine protein kinase n=1 Tax=Pendulispora rubella TaxID=2741070 RepID=A0ABZ2L3X7_9BACT
MSDPESRDSGTLEVERRVSFAGVALESLKPGIVLMQKYRIESILGRGGMGVVVAALNLAIDQRVALKFLTSESQRSPSSVERFTREARAAGKLRSEHVAKVIDVGRVDFGSPYIVMELLEGNDLKQLIADDGPLPVPRAVDYLLQAIDAVAEAHKHGIVHRDLKPANLFLTKRESGEPIIKLLDFGISKFQDVTDDPDRPGITVTSAFLGSPAYASPEQCRSPKYVDARSDIWSLGAVLYELLTGRRPFRGGSEAEVFAAVLEHDPAPMRSLRPEIPSALEAVVSRCLRKKPEERFPSVADLAVALTPLGTGQWTSCAERAVSLLGQDTTSIDRGRRSSRRRLLILGALLLAGAGGAIVSMRHRTQAPPEPKPVASEPAPSTSAALPVATIRAPAPPSATAPAVPSTKPTTKPTTSTSGRARSPDGGKKEPPSVGSLLETRQ